MRSDAYLLSLALLAACGAAPSGKAPEAGKHPQYIVLRVDNVVVAPLQPSGKRGMAKLRNATMERVAAFLAK